jgi:hypothetical protein
MKILITLLLFVMAAPVFGQTGVYYDRTVRGEGITTHEHEALTGEMFRTVYLYTFGDEECEIIGRADSVTATVEVTATATAICPNSIFPPHKPLCDPVVVEVTETGTDTATFTDMHEECDLNGQRWFLGTDEINKDGDSIGKLYLTEGMNFPECVPSLEPFEEDVDICADLILIGTYILRPAEEGGFLMWVESVDDNHTDPLFDHAYEFTTPLIEIK